VWDQQQNSGPNSISPESMYQQEAPLQTPSLPSQYSSQSSVDYRCCIGLRRTYLPSPTALHGANDRHGTCLVDTRMELSFVLPISLAATLTSSLVEHDLQPWGTGQMMNTNSVTAATWQSNENKTMDPNDISLLGLTQCM